MTTAAHDFADGPLILSDSRSSSDQGAASPSGDVNYPVPMGRLTLVSGSPEMPMNADYSSAWLYYAPFEGDKIPLFNGVSWGLNTFTSSSIDAVGLLISGGAKWAANTKRDVFVTLINGAPVLCTGQAWTDDAVASRGIIRRNGRWVNTTEMICDLSATVAVTVPVHQASWVGSINIGAVAGTLSATFTLGQNRRCDVWNAYHQKEILLGVGATPPVGSPIIVWKPQNQHPALQAFNNDLNNSGFYFTGLPQTVDCEYIQRGFMDSLNHGYCAFVTAVCKGSIDNPKGTLGIISSDTLTDAMGVTTFAVFKDRGSIGSHRVFMGTANANQLRGISMWGITNLGTRAPEESHVMWIKYLG